MVVESVEVGKLRDCEVVRAWRGRRGAGVGGSGGVDRRVGVSGVRRGGRWRRNRGRNSSLSPTTLCPMPTQCVIAALVLKALPMRCAIAALVLKAMPMTGFVVSAFDLRPILLIVMRGAIGTPHIARAARCGEATPKERLEVVLRQQRAGGAA